MSHWCACPRCWVKDGEHPWWHSPAVHMGRAAGYCKVQKTQPGAQFGQKKLTWEVLMVPRMGQNNEKCTQPWVNGILGQFLSPSKCMYRDISVHINMCMCVCSPERKQFDRKERHKIWKDHINYTLSIFLVQAAAHGQASNTVSLCRMLSQLCSFVKVVNSLAVLLATCCC